MRGDIIFLLLYLVTEFINYLLAYIVFFSAGINLNKKRCVMTVAFIFLVHYALLYLLGYEAAVSMSVVTMAVIPLFVLEKAEKKYLLIYPFVVIGTSSFSIGFSFVISFLLGIPEYMVVYDQKGSILCQCIPMFVLLTIFLKRKRQRNQGAKLRFDVQQYMLFYIGGISIFLMLSSMQLVSAGDLTVRNINICGLAISAASMVFVGLLLWQGVVVYRELQIAERAKRYEQYMKLQEEHFQQMMERDDKMRRVYHDINAHVTVLKAYCSEENNEELMAYLENIIKNSAVYDIARYTGNKGVDAILRQAKAEADKRGIQLEAEGVLPAECRVSVYDLCTIFSNLLSNALEAAGKLEQKSERRIYVRTGFYNDQLMIRIKNTVSEPVIIRDWHLPTTKPDVRLHGIGSENVYLTVCKYEGQLEYTCDDGWFEVNIIL